MGLSGRKVKQRIPNDPRNLSWADDAARFGSNYLSKFGWDASKGLGASGEGRMSHIKVSQKLDMMGIGAAHQKDPNGIAWKQNKEFENLLRRLNDDADAGGDGSAIEGFKKATEGPEEDVKNEEVKKKKRKDRDEEDGQEKKKKKKKDIKEAEETTPMQVDLTVEAKLDESKKTSATPSLPRHRAHRARAIAAKNISSKSANHISEILGIAPTPSSSSAFTSGITSGADTPREGKLTSPSDGLELEKITTSTKSVADYFAEKLKARSRSRSAAAPSTPDTGYTGNLPSGDDARRSSVVLSQGNAGDSDSYDEAGVQPRLGLGASRLRFELQSESRVEDETQQLALSTFSKLKSSAFLAATVIQPEQETELLGVENEDGPDEEKRKRKKDKKKEKAEATEETGKRKDKSAKKDKKAKRKAEELGVDVRDEDAGDDAEERKKKKKRKKSELGVEISRDEGQEDLDKISKKKSRKDKLSKIAEREDEAQVPTSGKEKRKKDRTSR